ncbi:ABL118Wp [Eremothecium gossypii ATCC 10895]|uniref:ABL118Wp n=1 Tax=Eremothecium gossypii (strain ATCC 10895 / CBS 109.51 / FGSC 9923 / NRRL Y-1056) TaxID=284811 RepID=Q75DZ1_EREGS|nr:ABL118Wp [Eremothecium gossypii ATCC 10895]AAS50653.1 ABL118Wp [Eremothecium gossypii ATCC 10895]AEY94941.1 FABL118Wp [Eremothecium gossypii FDAG1]
MTLQEDTSLQSMMASERELNDQLERVSLVETNSSNSKVHAEPGSAEKTSKKPKANGRPSAEEIEKIRAQRKAKKEAAGKQGGEDVGFIKRPLLVCNGDEAKGFVFRMMTYNCLAQALIRRKLFPTSGNALKWFKRSKVLLSELQYYNPDVICLQEIDHTQYKSFWMDALQHAGYCSKFHRSFGKNHGIAIVWRRSLFNKVDETLIDFDEEQSGEIERRTTTKNVGLIVALEYTDEIKRRYPGSAQSGIVVGTSHLFWHPFGTYERARQCYIILSRMKVFLKRLRLLERGSCGAASQWHPFFCGDFNSQPFDAPYLSMCSKPIIYEGRARTVIECSTSYKFSSLRDGCAADEEEGGNIEKFGAGQPETPVPDSFDGTPEQRALVDAMQSLHNALDMRAISLYSLAYRYVHPENAGIDNNRGEPEISNWAHAWRGLLDYIMYVMPWDFSDNTEVDDIGEFQKNTSVIVRSLLRVPPASEMPSHGQPHEGEYPSDHLSLMCELELLM